MELLLLAIDKTRESWVDEGFRVYEKRLQHYGRFRFETVIATKTLLPKDEQIKREEEALNKLLKPQDSVVLLDEQGKHINSVQFAQWLNLKCSHSRGRIVFIIGGPFGFSSGFKQGKELISLSPMTFSHQMVRVIFAEQLYRAFTILNGEPYHHP
ncbi:MAG: hypothetical protein RLZZ370_25 [Bacteroidota bacterium]